VVHIGLIHLRGEQGRLEIHYDADRRKGLFKCMRLNKVFNADLVAAYNILVMPITLSPERGGGNGPETRPGIKPSKRGDVIPNLSYNEGKSVNQSFAIL